MRRIRKRGIKSVSDLPYENYLRTTLWIAIRDWVVESQSGKCAVCNQKAAEVHHHDYDESTMLGKRSDGLVGLCARCHRLVEFDEDCSKRVSLPEKRVAYENLVSEFAWLVQEGFQVTVERAKLTILLKYVGQKEFLKFMHCSSMAYAFIIEQFLRSEMAFPMPLGREKLQQKSGIVITLRESAVKLAAIWATSTSIQIKLTKACVYPFEEGLRGFLERQPLVRIVQYERLLTIPSSD
jgi:hypothetical protein